MFYFLSWAENLRVNGDDLRMFDYKAWNPQMHWVGHNIAENTKNLSARFVDSEG